MSRRGRIIANVVVAFALIAVVGPLLWVVRVALRPQVSFVRDPAGIGGGWTLHNLADAWSIGGLGHALWNSTLVVVPGAALATALAALAGWGLAGYRFPGRSTIAGVMVAVIFVPLATLVMPLFDLGVRFDLVGHRWWLTVVYGTVFAAWGTLFLRSVFLSVPSDLPEAASIDGAGTLRVFFSEERRSRTVDGGSLRQVGWYDQTQEQRPPRGEDRAVDDRQPPTVADEIKRTPRSKAA